MKRFVKNHPEILSYEFSTWAVGVKGDERVYEPTVIVLLDPEFAKRADDVASLSTEITNRVNGISRVLWEVQPK